MFVPILPALMNREYLLRSDITLALAICRTVHKLIQIKRPCKEILMFVCAQHGERVRVTRWKKYWLYGDKVQVEGQVKSYFLNLSIFEMLLLAYGDRVQVNIFVDLKFRMDWISQNLLYKCNKVIRGRSHITSAAGGGRGGKPKADHC